jgi:hypothetical protein
METLSMFRTQGLVSSTFTEIRWFEWFSSTRN